MNCKLVLEHIHDQTKQYFKNNALESAVMGLSGGIDSTLVAAIMKPVLRDIDVTLIGISLPSSTNTEEEQIRAENTGRLFCHEYEKTYIDRVFEDCQWFCEAEGKVRRGNLKARLRMIKLYDKAQATGGLVLSTDNLTELMLGFWTLHGDVGDFGPIQQLYKTEVYEMASFVADSYYDVGEPRLTIKRAICAMATDGNGVTDTGDLGQIGAATWTEVDNVLKSIQKGVVNPECPITKRYLRTMYKRNNPFNLPLRHLIDGAING